MGEEFRETPYYMYSNPYHSMKARIKETGEIVDVEYGDDDLYVVIGRHQYLYASEFDVLSYSEEKDADTVIQGWVCRDKKDNALNLHAEEPYRTYSHYQTDDEPDWWESDCASFLPLDKSLFPDLTWESEPELVELIIKRKKK